MKLLQRCFWAAFFLLFAIQPALAANVQTSVTVVVVPNAPSDLTAVPAAPTQVTLSWTDNSNGTEDGFSIERKTGVGGTYAQIGTTGSGVATYIDNGVVGDTTYFYRVRAFEEGQYSAYSNEASVTTPSSGNGGGGGGGGGTGGGGGGGGSGGGGGGYAPPVTSVTITGSAYPLSSVTVLKDGQVAVQTIAGPDGNFFVSMTGLSGGQYTFYVYATDSAGRQSTPFTFPVFITPGETTNISGVFLSPTIDVDKDEVKQGDTLVIFGQSKPSAPITIQVDSAQPIFVNTLSASSGAYLYELDTADLALGSHVTKSEAASGTMMSSYSLARAFTVGNENVNATAPAGCPPKGDLNGDCKVNLVDFSVLAYWYGRPNPPASVLLDGASVVDLRDFSIMAYYWTG